MTHASSSATDGLRALVFDVDGTLADTERDGHRVAFNHAFADCGLDWCWTPRQYGDLLAVSGSRERLAHYIDRHQPALGDWRAEALVDEVLSRKQQHYVDLLESGAIALRPGVRRLPSRHGRNGALINSSLTVRFAKRVK